MTQEIRTLLIAAATVGFLHTLTGPDHYLPFIVMSWARKWSGPRTAVITVLCAFGHIGSSVVLGLVGVALGLAVETLTGTESLRGRIAAWLFIAFGLVYLIWGIRHIYRSRPHEHGHSHATDEAHSHVHLHSHFGEHVHVHDVQSLKSLTPWILFTIFVFGPCEPLIPFLMYPAANASLFGLVAVTVVFGIATMSTMLVTVFLGRAGIDFLPLGSLQRYSHALAGAAILLCGLAIEFMGL
jgi:nickel/cobalt exporter